jgi:hypothetical protein
LGLREEVSTQAQSKVIFEHSDTWHKESVNLRATIDYSNYSKE